MSIKFQFGKKTIAAVEYATRRICLKCKCELYQDKDHILPRQFAKFAKRLGIVMNSTENCGLLCGLCHHKKNIQEAEIGARDFEAVKIHVKKWQTVHFTKSGNRRIIQLSTMKNRQAGIAKIGTLKYKATEARKAGNKDLSIQLFGIRSRERKKLRRR